MSYRDGASTEANAPSMSMLPRTRNAPKIPSRKPKSPTRLTMNAFMAAALAEGLVYQNPISR